MTTDTNDEIPPKLAIGFIRGQKGAVWRNDAYPVYRVDPDGQHTLIGVVPAEELHTAGFTSDLILPAFELAVSAAGSREKEVMHQVVKDLLDARHYPKPGRFDICL